MTSLETFIFQTPLLQPIPVTPITIAQDIYADFAYRYKGKRIEKKVAKKIIKHKTKQTVNKLVKQRKIKKKDKKKFYVLVIRYIMLELVIDD
ncbi:MAG: hypothetical protein N3G19_03220 [Candidatus Pacearchaeota archaeon]|nr:hypothetical protein [Candidatus Pacearchaeota archaeon]